MKHCILTCTLVTLLSSATLQAGSVGVPKKEDVPKYLKMLTGSANAKDRALAAELLGRRGQVQVRDVKDAINPLLSAMKSDGSADVRRASAAALGNIGTQPKTVIPALSDALKDKSLAVNLAAVSALGQYGVQAREAVPALRQFAKSKNKEKKIMRMVNQTIKQINAPVQ
jgi:HEAT repeat protein